MQQPKLNTVHGVLTAMSDQKAKLDGYLLTNRGQRIITAGSFSRRLDRFAPALFAVNEYARRTYILQAVRALAILQARQGLTESFFVTLAPNWAVTSLKESPDFSFCLLTEFVADTLAGFNFIGAVEPALFTGVSRNADRKAISWHVHAIVWGDVELTLEARIAAAANEASLVPGHTTAHYRKFGNRASLGRLAYLLKLPLKEYRTYAIKTTIVDRFTGEVIEQVTGDYAIRKRPLRPGDASRLVNALSDRSIPDCMVAGGTGVKLTNRITEQSLKSFGVLPRRSTAHTCAGHQQ